MWLCSSSIAAAQPEEPVIRVGVVPGIAVNLDASRVDALSQELADALSAELVVAAVGGLEVRRKLPPEGLPSDCIVTPACVADVAKRLDAQQLLFVVMVDTGGAVQIDSTWLEPATGKSVSRPAIDLVAVSDAKAKFTTHAKLLLPDAAVRPKPKTGFEGVTPSVPRHLTKWSLISGGAAVVGLGVGIGFGLATRSSYNDCKASELDCSTTERDSVRTKAHIADAGWALAIAGTVTTAILYAVSGKESRLVVEPSPTGVAVSALGRF